MLAIIRDARELVLANPRVDMPGAEIIPGACRLFLPPPLPAVAPALTAAADAEGIVRLSWERSAQTIGLEAELHRSGTPDFAPDASTLLVRTPLSQYADRQAPIGPQHYALGPRTRQSAQQAGVCLDHRSGTATAAGARRLESGFRFVLDPLVVACAARFGARIQRLSQPAGGRRVSARHGNADPANPFFGCGCRVRKAVPLRRPRDQPTRRGRPADTGRRSDRDDRDRTGFRRGVRRPCRGIAVGRADARRQVARTGRLLVRHPRPAIRRPRNIPASGVV